MTKVVIFLFFIFYTFLSKAQETYNDKGLVVSKADLRNTIYSKDTTANAFYIYEKGFSRIQNGGGYNLLTDYSAKIKILNNKGYHKTEIEIFLYKDKSSKEKLRKLVAHTYNLVNGEINKTKVEEANIYEEKYDEHYTVVKFTFPNIKPGSVISYSYQLESPFIYKFNGWDFQDDIPKMYSEYIADTPGNYLYNIKLIGSLKLSTNESSIIKRCIEVGNGGSADCAHSVYAMEDIPAFKEEEFMTAKKNYFSRMDYELKEVRRFDGTNKKYTETWKNVDKKLKIDESIGIQLKKIGATKDILPDSITKASNTIEKAKHIFDFISNTHVWNGDYKIFKDVNIKNVIKNKVGNVSGINILLHNTLKQQGYEVKPVLLSTRKNGYVTKLYPVIYDFNYLIIQLSLDGKNYLLDATETSLPFGELPFRCLNQYGRLLDFKNGSSWIDIESKMRSYHYFKENIKLTEENITGTGTYAFAGYHGYHKRNSFKKTSQDQYIKKIKNLYEEIDITDISFKNLKNVKKPFVEERSFIYPAEETEGLIFINPFTNPFFKENPFKLAERTYPVDFGYKKSYTYLVSIEVPADYEFVDIPKNLNYKLPNGLGKINLNFEIRNNILSINHRIIFSSSYYPTEYYASVKDFFNFIVDMENNTLITVKKAN